MIGTPGPFQIIGNEGNGKVDRPMLAPRRRYACENYEKCLNLTAALNWDNFTCRGCSGEICQNLLWRAHQAKRSDKVARRICDIPQIPCIAQSTTDSDNIDVVVKAS